MPAFRPRLADCSLLLVLAALATVFSLSTIKRQQPEGAAAGESLARQLRERLPQGGRVLVAASDSDLDRQMAARLRELLADSPLELLPPALGSPRDARLALAAAAGDQPLDAVAASRISANWIVFSEFFKAQNKPAPPIIQPASYLWPDFLKLDNLRNIANQIAVTAVLAIGMTVVIISGGIDLSVGRLIGLSSVVMCLLIERWGGVQASFGAVAGAGGIALLLCAAVGAGSGVVITVWRLPPFLVTLAVMLVSWGLAGRLTGGEQAYRVPAEIVWFSRGAILPGVPNAVLWTGLLYLTAALLLRKTVAGRHLYALGGNREAARLSGVRVERLIVLVYALSATLAGFGGVLMASELKSGAATYGESYELFAIAAAVVGGTSLAGGVGSVGGTLLGALIIAVINNGMTLIGLDAFSQRMVLGALILGAVAFDGWQNRRR